MNDAPLEVGIGVIVRWRHLLLLGKRKGSHGAGQWAAPGGKPNPGETPEDAAYREVQEETSINLVKIEPVNYWSYDAFPDAGKHFVTIWFTAEPQNPTELETREPEKCEGWGWWPLSDHPTPVWTSLDAALDLVK